MTASQLPVIPRLWLQHLLRSNVQRSQPVRKSPAGTHTHAASRRLDDVSCLRRSFSAVPKLRQKTQHDDQAAQCQPAASPAAASSSFLAHMQQRGLIQATTHDLAALQHHLSTAQRTIYLGIDPTAQSLHAGHLLVLTALQYFYRHGHRCIVLVGGATGMIGDPSGRSDERKLLTADEVTRNAERITQSIRSMLQRSTSDNSKGEMLIVNNYEWHSQQTLIPFLRDIGKHFKLSSMLQRDSVRDRLQHAKSSGNEGMSYTEFTYMLLQAMDYVELHKRYGCSIQIGGSDQWGNIVSGIDLIHRLKHQNHATGAVSNATTSTPNDDDASAFGMTIPLLTTSDGQKIGKSTMDANSACWLDPQLTSPFQFYQYWLGVGDAEVSRFMKLLTLMTDEEIQQYDCQSNNRDGLHRLATELTTAVHGHDECQRAIQTTQVLFGNEAGQRYDTTNVSRSDLLSAFAGVPTFQLKTADDFVGQPISQLAVQCGASASKADVRRLVLAGGLYVNNERVADPNYKVTASDLLADSVCIIRAGKSRQHLVVVHPAQ